MEGLEYLQSRGVPGPTATLTAQLCHWHETNLPLGAISGSSRVSIVAYKLLNTDQAQMARNFFLGFLRPQ